MMIVSSSRESTVMVGSAAERMQQMGGSVRSLIKATSVNAGHFGTG